MREKVYISGAIAHQDLKERMEAFDNAARWLELKGFAPINPFNNGLPPSSGWSDHMRADLRMLLVCERIYMLRGWEQSLGARLELEVACSCGIKVVFEGED